MSGQKLHVDIFDLVRSIASIIDLMSPAVGSHHMQVAYWVYQLGDALNYSDDEKFEFVIAAALHDIGAFTLKERLDLLEFEETKPGEHARAGNLILDRFKPFSSIAQLVKFHHTPWQNGDGAFQNGEPVPVGSHLIHLADRVAVKIKREEPVLSQVHGIIEAISEQKGRAFVPEHVDALLELTKREYIWLDATSDSLDVIITRLVRSQTREFSMKQLVDFSQLICRLIDFKSEFTAAHSSGVAAVAVELSRLIGFPYYECRLIEIAAYFHDVGKLAIPSEILEKQDKLTENERFIMRSHVYYTYQMLEPFDVLKPLSEWASFHQERLNGTGYPFGLDATDLPDGARIMAVADVFTALTEDRPYRKGMDTKSAMSVLQSMVNKGELDGRLVDMVFNYYETLNEIRASAQQEAMDEYNAFQAKLNQQVNV
jgi:HD-GYP domain-containing protein (c-di-GMP phosphodiesterase class II)